MVLIIILGVIIHFGLGYLTHYLMYLKCRKALYPIGIRYFIHEKYDILNKDRADPRSDHLHGVVVICNGAVSFLIYFISQLYWTGFKSIKYFYDKYINKLSYVMWKHYCIKNVCSYDKTLENFHRSISKDEIRNDPVLMKFMGYSTDYDIDWRIIIKFDTQNNIYFNGKKCNSTELYDSFQSLVRRYNSHMPINHIDEL